MRCSSLKAAQRENPCKMAASQILLELGDVLWDFSSVAWNGKKKKRKELS